MHRRQILLAIVLALLTVGLVSAQGPTLQTDLVAWWKLDEASGTRADSAGSLDLTDNNTCGQVAGVVGNAVDIVKSNSEYLSHADDPDFDLSGDWTINGWAKWSDPANDFYLISKDAGGDRAYSIFYHTGAGQYRLLVSGDGASVGFVNYGDGGSIVTDTWNMLTFYHDSAADEIGFGVNAGTPITNSYSAGMYNSGQPFFLGRYYSSYGDISIDELAIWDRLLTQAELDWLYDSGSGRTYEDILPTPTPTIDPNMSTYSMTLPSGGTGFVRAQADFGDLMVLGGIMLLVIITAFAPMVDWSRLFGRRW